MAKSLIIVEDDSDKYTFEAIIRHINLQDKISVTGTPEIDWKPISDENNPLQPKALIRGLRALANDISNQKYDRIGIIRDMDSNTSEDRLQLVNNALKEAYPNEYRKLGKVNELIAFEFMQNGTGNRLEVNFACFFVHYGGRGEIEDILKAVKALPSPLADCIDNHLPDCLGLQEDKLREKDLVKLWFNHYQRYDTLGKNDRKSPYTTTKYIMEHRSELFDFEKAVPELEELKEFLKMMTKK